MPKAHVNGIQLNYFQSGKGPDLVLVHGLGGNLAAWHLTMVPELQQHYRVTTFDLRGHGRSDAPETGYTTGELAGDLLGILNELGIERPHLVGHSLGGDISLHFARLHPDRVSRLVIIEGAMIAPLAPLHREKNADGWEYVAQTLETLLGARFPAEKRRDLEFILKKIIELPIVYGPRRGQARDAELVHRVLHILKPMLYGDGKQGNLELDHLPGIPHPTLLVYEEESLAMKSYEVLRSRLPDVEGILLPRGKLKHFTVLEQPALILQHVLAFLRRTSPPLSSTELQARPG